MTRFLKFVLVDIIKNLLRTYIGIFRNVFRVT